MKGLSFFSRSTAGIVLLGLDIGALLLIFGVVHSLHVGYPLNFTSIQLYAVVAFTCLILYMLDVYRIDYNFPSISFPIQGIFAVGLAGLILAAIIYILPEETRASSRSTIYWRGVLIVSMAVFAGWVALSRFAVSAIYNYLASIKQWMIIGHRDTTERVINDLNALSQSPQLVALHIGSVGSDGDDEPGNTTLDNIPASITDSQRWAGIIVGDHDELSAQVINALLEARFAGMRIYDVSDFYETFMLKVPVEFIHDQWLIRSQGFDLVYHNAQLKLKQLVDLVIAVLLLVPAVPLSILIGLAIAVDSPGGIFYSQERVGLNGRVFRIYKFRTMIADAEKNGAQWAGHRDARVTRVGRLLRPARLDEIPQLWNVLRGHMSFIGPRPERPAFTHDLEERIPYYGLRVLVKPGITGWAQVQYPYGSSIEDARRKLEYDLYYIKNYSILLDIAILFKTLRVILFRSGR